MAAKLFQLLQISDVLDLEFASALAEQVPVVAWEPLRLWLPSRIAAGSEAERTYPGSSLRIRSLPMLRGYSRPPLSWLAQTGRTVSDRLKVQAESPQNSPLICTTPYLAPVAEHWPGPVVYWLTDLIAMYSSANRRQVEALDRRMVRAATLVCPNSRRIRSYLIDRCGCDPRKIVVTPNATRASNVLLQAPRPAEAVDQARPPALESIADLKGRPIAGVIGNLAGNMDWLLIEQVIHATPWLSWVFVGPTTMDIVDPLHRAARAALLTQPRVHFVGRQPYGDLASFARSFDVAILPYRRCEPTYSGSSTRFYEHLAACRPMIATRGLQELEHKTDLLCLVDDAAGAIAALEGLRSKDFDDGLVQRRWQQSLESTWQARAAAVVSALDARLHAVPEIPIKNGLSGAESLVV